MKDLRRHDRESTATKAEGQFKTALGFDPKAGLYADPLAALQLDKATNDDFLDWRDRLRSGRNRPSVAVLTLSNLTRRF